MNPIEFGAELFKTADELQAKTIKALEVIAKIDEKLGAMPEQFKIPIICAVTEAVLECENVSNALAQEPCDDAISRQAAIDSCLNGWNKGYEEIVEEIRALPPVTPAEKPNKWIPVSERLPEDGQSVLFCDIDNDIMVGYHVKGRPDTHFSQNGTYEDMKNVRAWMPLPEPYKASPTAAESEDKE